MCNQNSLLSIAIPTYNFASFLPETLESLIPQAKKSNIEIVVFDGCSQDDTREVVKTYQESFSRLRYIKALAKGGIDYDMAMSLSMCSSEYCWLFSGDDICLDGSVEYLLSILDRHMPDMVLGRHNECNFNMQVIKDWPVLKCQKGCSFNLGDLSQRKEYLSLAQTSEAFFSFMSGLILKRETWFRGRLDSDKTIKNWGHVTRLWRLTNENRFHLYYTPKILLNRRGENDSFSENGMLERLKLQISGLQSALAAAYPNDPDINITLKRVLRNEIFPNWADAVMADLKMRKAPESVNTELEELLNSIRG